MSEQLRLFDDKGNAYYNPGAPKPDSLRRWRRRGAGEPEVTAVEENNRVLVFSPGNWRFIREISVEEFLDQYTLVR